jgi:serine/threonine protein phosphatase 1
LADSITFAIGDIHGCYDKLRSLLEACERIGARRPTRFICLGDYVDRGPDTEMVVALLIRKQAIYESNFVCIRGNHEQMLLEAAAKGRFDRDLMKWWGNGGEQALDSYGVNDPSDLPVEHLDWMRGLPLQTRDHHRLFVHAGIRPGVPLLSQSAEDLLWMREPFLSSEEDHGVVVVHGHTPTRSRKPDLRPNRLNIDTGACFGGPLTAAVFSDEKSTPLFFVNDSGDILTPGEQEI